MNEYKIKELITSMPEAFPPVYWVLVQAVEKNTNLIRLFISKTKTVKTNNSESKQKMDKEIFADKFVFRIATNQNYEIINYNPTLKFSKYKRGRYYCRYLIDNNGKRVRDI